MAESPSKTGGAGLLARQMQKRFLRAQEMVLQKIGKTMEMKDDQFEQCANHFNKQQADGNRLRKDLRAFLTAVKVMHETSQRLSLTLQEVYETEWEGKEELQSIIENNELLWEDYEEKLSDQALRTLETYLSQFPVFKKRIAKRGRRLVHYNVCRQHLESLQSAKKRDETKIGKAEEEFINAQNEFEELNAHLREELPELWNSRIGCYVTIFQNMSNLRDIFYEEMSKLNQALYSVMTKLEKQHSTKVFIVKGVASNSHSLMVNPETVLSEDLGSKDESFPLFIEDSPSPATAAQGRTTEESRRWEDTPLLFGTTNPSPGPEGLLSDSPTAPAQDASSSGSLLQAGKSNSLENSKLDSPAVSVGDCTTEIQGGGLWPEESAQPELSGDDSAWPCTDHDSNLSPSVRAPSTTPVVADEEITSSFPGTAPSPSSSTAQDANSAPMPFADEVWNSAEPKASHEELPILMAAEAFAPSESQQTREVTTESRPTGYEASQPEVEGHGSSAEDQASAEAVPQVSPSSAGASVPEDLVHGSSEASPSPEG